MEEQIKIYNKLITGELSSLVYYKTTRGDDRIKDVCVYLHGKGVGYTIEEINSSKYGKGLEIKIKELIVPLYYYTEDYFLTKEEEKLLKLIDNKRVDEYHYFITPKQFDEIRFDLIKCKRPSVDLTAMYNRGLVIIRY